MDTNLYVTIEFIVLSRILAAIYQLPPDDI